MGVASSGCYQRCGAFYFRIVQANELRNSPQFRFRVLEKEIVMSDEPLFSSRRFDQPSVIDFPKAQTKRIRRSISLAHRVSDFERITHDDQRFQPRQEALPKRQR